MKTHRGGIGLATLIAAAAALLGIMAWSGSTTSAQSTQAPPPRPPWVGPNGVLDRSKLPACFHIVGPDGQQVKDQDGKPLCGNPFDVPVSEPEEEVKKRAVPSGENVPWQRPPGAPAGPNDPPKRH